jgi:hypothetical protein
MRRACWKSLEYIAYGVTGCGVNELSIGLNHHQNAKTDVLACKGSTWAAMSQTWDAHKSETMVLGVPNGASVRKTHVEY